MNRFCKVFWPRLEPKSKIDNRQLKKSTRKALKKIERADWKSVSEILEEARALHLRDETRIKFAETKAAIYLSALAVVASLSVALIQNFFSFPNLPEIQRLVLTVCTFLIFLIAIVYSFNAGIWAFRTIKVRTYYQVDVEHLIDLTDSNADVFLCRDILIAARISRDVLNEKIDCMQMAHEFVIRMFVCYFILLMIVGSITIATAGLGYSEESQQSLSTLTGAGSYDFVVPRN